MKQLTDENAKRPPFAEAQSELEVVEDSIASVHDMMFDCRLEKDLPNWQSRRGRKWLPKML